MGNNYMGGPYGMGGLGIYSPPYGSPYSRTSASSYTDNKRFSFKFSAADNDYIYVTFGETKGEGRQALAIFETSGSDDCEYLSHITLGDTLDDVPEKIIVRGDLAVIGTYSGGKVYLIDISDKEDPEIINKLVLGRKYGGTGRVTSLAIEDKVLFVSIEFEGSAFEGSGKHIIFSLDISDPEETDEDDDLLDSYKLDDDDYQEIYNMVSVPGYLYISAKYEDDPTILIMDISEPDDLSIVETLDMKGEKEVSVAINGDYLLATVQVEDSSFLEEGACEFKVIDISDDPKDPEIISSSEEFNGRNRDWYENMVIKGNYAYVFVITEHTETKIYVFDISDPLAPDLVEKSKSIDGMGAGLYFVDDRLCLQTSQIITMFDISDPTDISVDETVDLHDILEDEDELDGWGVDRSSSSYYSSSYYGGYTPPSPWGDNYLCTGLGHYVPMEPGDSFLSGLSGWGGPTYPPTMATFGSYGGSGYSGPGYGGSPYPPSYPPFGSYGGSGYSGWGGPPYGGYSSYSSGGYTPPSYPYGNDMVGYPQPYDPYGNYFGSSPFGYQQRYYPSYPYGIPYGNDMVGYP